MKIAISGKGGVGKTTLSAFLCKWFGDQGRTVLAIDATPPPIWERPWPFLVPTPYRPLPK